MAAALKFKLAISVISAGIIILVPMLDSNFFRTPIKKEWSRLTWDDFQGIKPPFTRFLAAIHSTIELRYDSASRQFRSVAVQNNMRSWKSELTANYDYDYSLQHEQTHFNITEFQSKRLNDYIKENPEGNSHLFNLRLKSIKYDLAVMQDEFDRESAHGSRVDLEMVWRYKIDSLLFPGMKMMIDHVSGLRFYHPGEVFIDTFFDENGNRIKTYDSKYYKISFQVRITQRAPRLKIRSSWDATVVFHHEPIKVDSGVVTRAKLATDGVMTYNVEVRYYDEPGYREIGDKLFNSVNVVNTDEYWIQKAARETPTISVYPRDSKQKSGEKRTCYVPQSGPQGLTRGPFLGRDKSLYLVVEHNEEQSHLEHLMITDEDVFVFQAQNDFEPILYRLPPDIAESRSFMLFGYTLRSDTANACFQFYNEGFDIFH